MAGVAHLLDGSGGDRSTATSYSTKMSGMYRPVDPDETGQLVVGDGHIVYWERVGRRDGVPALYLHGGPGSGAGSGARRYFDPDVYRAVLFDQRGCGRSRPLAEDASTDLTTNTTAHLVADIERLREQLGVERWVVVGLSWGVTLGLVYAQAYPERVSAMVLAAITTGTRREVEWITRDIGCVFPQEWEAFMSLVPEQERAGNLSTAYARLLASADADVRREVASAWCRWEDTHVSLTPGWRRSTRYDDPTFRAVFARLVTHYWSHDCFLIEGQVLAGMRRLRGIPAVLIHGRWDISSPMVTAWELHRAWPGSRLVVLDDGGHGGMSMDDAITAALDGLIGTLH